MRNKSMLSGAFVLALFVLLGSTALAGSAWYVNGITGSDNNDCKTPRTACKTIGHAISLASWGDSISVAAATYNENLTIPTSLTIHGDFANSAPTIIDGGGLNTVVTIPDQGTNVTLSMLTIRNGRTAADGGGGITNSATLVLNRSTVSGNSASGNYGAGGIDNLYGTLTINNSAISGNSASGNYGSGGIENRFGTLAISHSAISGNSASGNYGAGGIENLYGTLTIKNSTLSGNSAPEGGGIYNYYGTLMLSNSTLSGNSANYSGGAIANFSTATISNSTLSGNSAYLGGGGGVDNGGALTVSNSTINGNSAFWGGGIYGSGTATLQNTIIANSPSGGNCSGSVTSNGYNLSSDDSCSLIGPGDLLNTDPKLGTLQNNGGPTWTHALLDGSPAIDAGNPNGCTDGNGNVLKTDQRGYPRPDPGDPGGCDMGAYEYQD